ncbi:MAG: DUF2207 domain-containing protein [Saprospiraceae bacterium]|nr:DUF2207 domain-containing protein [Saprospiraceae bacterium]
MKRLQIICLVFLWFFGTVPGYSQQERILNYDTQIELHKDRSITVTEFIEVYVNGDIIKRGLTRRLPTQRNLNGKSVSVKYDILEVEKNGQPEPYRKESNNGLMLYLGSADVFLNPGVYQYKIKYQVPDQIGFFDDYDELYWNAIGNDVEFNIEKASCRVSVPSGAEIVQQAAYVGAYGQQSQEYTVTNEGSVLDYRVSRSLQPLEGFTVSVAVNKGVFDQPNILQRLGTLILIILASIFLIPYYIYTWWKHGQDPPTPASYPMWNAPDGLSAASVNYVSKGAHDSKSFTASVINLAIKGYLKIEEVIEKGFFSKSTNFDLIQLKASDGQLPKEDKQLLDNLFRYDERVSITGKYDSNIEKAYSSHGGSLSAQHSAFLTKGHNARFLVTPILITIAVIGIAIFLLVNSPYAEGANIKSIFSFAPLAIIGLILYGYLIRKPTPEKLDLQARIKGFQMYLELAEKRDCGF